MIRAEGERVINKIETREQSFN